jgi:hypothetical protein
VIEINFYKQGLAIFSLLYMHGLYIGKKRRENTFFEARFEHPYSEQLSQFMARCT